MSFPNMTSWVSSQRRPPSQETPTPNFAVKKTLTCKPSGSLELYSVSSHFPEWAHTNTHQSSLPKLGGGFHGLAAHRLSRLSFSSATCLAVGQVLGLVKCLSHVAWPDEELMAKGRSELSPPRMRAGKGDRYPHSGFSKQEGNRRTGVWISSLVGGWPGHMPPA